MSEFEMIATLQERLDRFQAFAKAHEAWEAKLIMGDYSFLDECPTEIYKEMMEVQKLRNEAMKTPPPPSASRV